MGQRVPVRGRKLRNAIESVFRRTHGREMTAEERRLFGLAPHASPDGNARENLLRPDVRELSPNGEKRRS